MSKKMEVLALIPARAGSQGVPKKNITPVGGKPMLAWSIEAAKASAPITRIIVSTDSDEIAKIGVTWGAEAPFLRPADISTSTATAMDALLHTLEWLQKNEGYQPEFVVLLQPTSPLRTATDIDAAWTILRNSNAKAILGVTPVRQFPEWLYYVNESGQVESYLDPGKTANKQRQQLPNLYCSNGAIYILETAAILATKSWFPEPTVAYIMPPERSIDIDTLFDLKIADLLLRNREST